MMYDRNLLFAISSTIGKPLRIDNNALNATRGVDLTRPLKGEMFLNGERLQIEYESLHLICSCCGRYGHDYDHCPEAPEKIQVETNVQAVSADGAITEITDNQPSTAKEKTPARSLGETR
ncbi:hypothetical protein V2J09_015529 [Rumex salicifolius]